MAGKKKLAAAAVAAATATALLMGGTFAWQSVSQMALNEASDVINPGGRLHDDFYIDGDGNYNADIYVENFADEPIIARVKLQEYMEVVINRGTPAEVVDTIVGQKSLNDEVVTDKATDNVSGYAYEYVTHYFDQQNATDDFWNWTMGAAGSAQVWYMPTFNMNKDSLVTDRNGMYVDRIGGISNRSQEQYEDWTVWADGDTKDGAEIHDTDSNQSDEVGYDFENLDTYVQARNIATKSETHTAKQVAATNGLISMSEWLDLKNNGDDTSNYWVYDTDGWVYWSSFIPGGEATGLLLDGIELAQVMDDTWYYAINAVGQFVTPDDIGKDDNSGFYADGEAPSSNAEILLEEVGADVPEGGESISTHYLELNWNEDAEVSGVAAGDAVILSVNENDATEHGDPDLSSVIVTINENEETLVEGEDYTYDSATFTLIILNEDVDVVYVNEISTSAYGGIIYLGEGGSSDEDDDEDDDEENWSDSVITVNGQSPDDEGYIYLSKLNIDQNNSFTVSVSEDFELAEGGLTADFHEHNITDTTLVVDADDPRSATLTIAARDYHSVTIHAESVDGDTESVTVVPVYSTIVITPDMNGEKISLPNGYYSLRGEEFDGAVNFELTGAKRCNIYDADDGKRLSVSSYESSPEFTLTVTDGTQTATVTLTVTDSHPYDGPNYTYYINGKGETWSYALMQTQQYSWMQNDSYTYEIGVSMTNDYAGVMDWTIEGATAEGTVYFVNGEGENALTYTGEDPEIKFTAGQTQPFTVRVTIYADANRENVLLDEYGDPYNSNSQYFIISPVQNGATAIRYLSVNVGDWSALYLAPGENSDEVTFFSSTAYESNVLTNADVTWSLVTAEEGCTFTIEEGDADECYATVTHTCTEESCTRIGAVQVKVSYDAAYGMEAVSDNYIAPTDYAGSLNLGSSDDGGDEEFDSGNLILDVTGLNENNSWEAGATVTIEIEGYEDLSLFTWEILEGGVCQEDTPGMFTHYESSTQEYSDCPCITEIKATLTSDPEIWGAVRINCA